MRLQGFEQDSSIIFFMFSIVICAAVWIIDTGLRESMERLLAFVDVTSTVAQEW